MHILSKTLVLPVKCLNIKNSGKAFTMAETLVVVSMLGIVAMLTIPSLYFRHTQSLNRTKVKKSMSNYDSLIRRMKAEHKLSNEDIFNTWVRENANCGNTTQYFIKNEGNGCIFRTSDDVWWNITDINKPIIAFKHDDLTSANAEDLNSNTAFYFVNSFDNNNRVRINDIEYERQEESDNIQILEKLYNFISN